MFQHQGIWLPDGEKHFPEWMTKNGEIVNGKGTYQIKKIRAALAVVTDFRRAIDVGAHVGLWAMHLAPKFHRLEAFEPVPAFRSCFVKNVPDANVTLHPYALGSVAARVGIAYNPADSGGTHVSGSGDFEMRTLDSFSFDDVGFLKIDCEGYEVEVLRGARETLNLCRPVVIVEQKPHKLGPNFGIFGTPAVTLLKESGYRLVKEIGGDYIMAPA